MKGMRLVITMDYNTLMFPEDTDASAILKAFTGIRMVDVSGYGDEKKYILKEGSEISIQLVHPNRIVEKEKNEKERV